jgi:hypothetical protein
MTLDDAINEIVKLAGEARSERENENEHSPAYHKLTGALAAYEKALEVLLKLDKQRNRIN